MPRRQVQIGDVQHPQARLSGRETRSGDAPQGVAVGLRERPREAGNADTRDGCEGG